MDEASVDQYLTLNHVFDVVFLCLIGSVSCEYD